MLLEVFIELARHIIENGGTVSFEWPAHCIGWKIPGLEHVLIKNSCEQAVCHACAFGLMHRGRPIKKPWRIMSTHKPLINQLEKYRCTENCTPQMAQVIVTGVLTPGIEQCALPTASIKSYSAQLPSTAEGALDLSYAGSGEADMTEADRAMAARFSDGDGQHRCKSSESPSPFMGRLHNSTQLC